MMINILIVLGCIVSVFALVYSISIMRRQENKEMNRQSNATVRHPYLANPIVIAYVLFPIIIIVGAMIWLLFREG